MQDSTLVCGRCKKRTSVSEMRYDKDGKSLICKECYAYRYNNNKLESFGSERKMIKNEKKDPYEGMVVKYRCNICKQNFTLKRRADIRKRCPFCGRENITDQDTDLDADALIREASKKEYDF